MNCKHTVAYTQQTYVHTCSSGHYYLHSTNFAGQDGTIKLRSTSNVRKYVHVYG